MPPVEAGLASGWVAVPVTAYCPPLLVPPPPAMVREVMAGILGNLEQQGAAELALLEARLPVVPEQIPHIHFAEAQELILKLHGLDVRGEPDLSPQDERWVGEWAQAEYVRDCLFGTGYPLSTRPFDTRGDGERPQYSNSF